MKQCDNYKSSSGFTLVEILVTATIIGLLSTIGVTGFQAITRSGRDGLRKSDLEQIRSALEIYKSENKKYPIPTVECTASLSTDYVNPYPQDPNKPTYNYCYLPATDPALTYTICAHLENGDTATDNCGAANKCGGNCNYQVTNP